MATFRLWSHLEIFFALLQHPQQSIAVTDVPTVYVITYYVIMSLCYNVMPLYKSLLHIIINCISLFRICLFHVLLVRRSYHSTERSGLLPLYVLSSTKNLL